MTCRPAAGSRDPRRPPRAPLACVLTFGLAALCALAATPAPATAPPSCPGGWSFVNGDVSLSTACAAYDVSRGRVVLLSEGSRGGAIMAATWEWDGTSWSLRTQSGPPKRL